MEKIKKQIKNYDNRIKEINHELELIARNNPPHNMPNEYYEVKKEQQRLIYERSILIDELAGKNKTNSKHEKKFVNSYGEATTRYITSTIYERSMKILKKDILRNMGL